MEWGGGEREENGAPNGLEFSGSLQPVVVEVIIILYIKEIELYIYCIKSARIIYYMYNHTR